MIAHGDPGDDEIGGVEERRSSNRPETPGGRQRNAEAGPSPFPHPPWTVNLVLVAGVIALLFGLLVHPVWLVVGSPFVIALLLWLFVRLFTRR